MRFAGLTGPGAIGRGGLLGLVLGLVLISGAAVAQSTSPHTENITPKQYVEETGGVARYVAPGRLKLAGRRVLCGKRPSVTDPEFDTWAGAYTNPGFIIVNPIFMSKEPKVVQFYIYAHECGHQFRGFDEDTADAFAIRRGVRQGWLSRAGMKEVCKFISQVPGDAEHPAGPLRCKRMTRVYHDIVARHKRAVVRRANARKNRKSRLLLGAHQ